jgi:hypothetical protein
MTRSAPLPPDLVDWSSYNVLNGPNHALSGISSYEGLSQLNEWLVQYAAVAVDGVVDVGGHYTRPGSPRRAEPAPPVDRSALSKKGWNDERRASQRLTMQRRHLEDVAYQDELTMAGLTDEQIRAAHLAYRKAKHLEYQRRWRGKNRHAIEQARRERRAMGREGCQNG